MNTPRHRHLLYLVIALLLAAVPAFGQEPANIPSGFQIVLDGGVRMVNKDVQQPDGTLERWAIMYDPARIGVASTTPGVFIGNVFRATGGEPAFVYCSALPAPDSQNVAFQCWGADKCQTSSCPSNNDWTVIASADHPFVVPNSFFEPRPVTVPQPTATPQPTDDLSALIGTWNFTFTIISTFTDTYHLQRIITGSSGKRGLSGVNQFGGTVVAARIQEISPGSTLPYEFELLDPASSLECDYHVFNRTGATTVGGLTSIMLTDSTGACDPSTILNVYDMSGVRISTSALTLDSEGLVLNLDDAARARGVAVIAESGAISALTIPDEAAIKGAAEALLETSR
jgi:hypothetical protein